jgi:hypothetical protein
MNQSIDIKLIEVRDMCTNITVFAFRTCDTTAVEDYYFNREGYGVDTVVMGRLATMEANIEHYGWENNNTLFVAHSYIEDHFDELKTGDVVDVAFLNGRRDAPVKTDRPEHLNW